MKRWILVACLALVSALAFLAPTGATASTLAATKLSSGKPVKVTISTPGQQVKYTFAAKAKTNVTFNVTHFDFSQPGGPDQITLYFYEPDSSTEYTVCNIDTNTYCNFTAPVTGTWSITLIPYESDTGSLTLTFANDVPTEALTAGTAVTTTIKYSGQEAGYTFAATAKKTAKFMITRFGFSQPGGPDQVIKLT
jgi:hypothetical protein